MSERKVKDTCIQAACFFLPFFEAGEWRRGEKSPWKTIRKAEATPSTLRALASYTHERISHSAHVMEVLMDVHDDWKVTVKKDGIFMETVTMAYEEILPRLKEAGVSEDDFQLYSEYTRKWGMI